MAKLKLEIEYKRKAESIEEMSNIDLTIDYIGYIVDDTHKEKQLTGQMMRLWGRLQRKLDKASDEKAKWIEIEDAEKDFIENALDKAHFPTKQSKWMMIFAEEVLMDEEKPKKTK